MALYTRTGDTGQTRMFGGVKAFKNDTRVEAYGSLDELNSVIGVVMAELPCDFCDVYKELEVVQQDLFDCIADLATVENKREYRMIYVRTSWLEDRIDFYYQQAPKITKFITPGGGKATAYMHLARTVARRSERSIVELFTQSEDVNPDVLTYVNRLSDYLFILARAVNAYQSIEETAYHKSPKVFRHKKEDTLPRDEE